MPFLQLPTVGGEVRTLNALRLYDFSSDYKRFMGIRNGGKSGKVHDVIACICQAKVVPGKQFYFHY